MDFKIALTGNPNVGKTSLFNRLTRSFEHVGNWHGVTVKKTSKRISFGGEAITIDDLPGLYSLSAISFEESVARDCLLALDYDVVVNICEVNNLARNLYLTLQLIELDLPTVLVVNMIDELEAKGKGIDIKLLEARLGVPVLGMSAKYKIDSAGLLSLSIKHALNFKGSKIKPSYLDKLPIDRIISSDAFRKSEAGVRPQFAAIKILENDEYIAERLNLSLAQVRELQAGEDTQSRVAALRYDCIERITDGIIFDKRKKRVTKDDRGNLGRIDRVVLNRYLALPIFLGLMALIFTVTFGFIGRWMSEGLEWAIQHWLYNPVSAYLEKRDVSAWFSALICEGIISGVGGILVFLPQIVLLFFFLALLEDSGYISRVAFMTDGLFRKIGLSGRSAFTMLMGFGCSATAVLTARGLEDSNMRKKTILLTPFMSCSARLPVYSAIGGAFFIGTSPLLIFALYFLGAFVALSLAAILEKTKALKSGSLSFIMEIPPYRLPTLERVRQIILNNSKVFLVKVGTLIFSLNVLVWVLSNFSIYGYTADTEYVSFLESLATLIAPIFAPLGFGNWQSVTALMSGLIAKEAVLGTVESLGGVTTIFSGTTAGLDALCFLVFTLLYVPCVATLGAIAKEIGAKWAIFSLVLQIGVAYLVALLIRGVGLMFLFNTTLAVSLLLGAVVLLLLILALTLSIKGHKCSGCCGCKGREGE